MKKHFTEKDFQDEFQEFMSLEPTLVPPSVSQQVLTRIESQLSPSVFQVFAKLSLVQGIVGTLSLSICDQFGMSPFNSDFSLSDYFMKFGHSTCMVFCGFLFISLGLGVGQLLLQQQELLVLKRSYPLQVLTLSLLSLGVFAVFGAEMTLLIGLFWFFGAMLGGMVSSFASRFLHLRKA